MPAVSRGILTCGVAVQHVWKKTSSCCPGGAVDATEADSCDEDPVERWPLAEEASIIEEDGQAGPGRPLHDTPLPKSLQMRYRRRTTRPQALIALSLAHLVRVRVICKRRLVLASDCRRMLRLAHYLRNAGAGPKQVAMALLYDRAWREPQLTRQLMEQFTLAKMWSGSANEGMWQAIEMVKKAAPPTRHNGKYWKGPTALHSARMPHMWPRDRVERIAERLGSSVGQSVDGRELADLMHSKNPRTGLQLMSAYHVYHYLRVAAMALPFDLQYDLHLARNMSTHVQWLLALVPKHLLIKHLGALKGGDLWLGNGDLALIACEGTKVLLDLGLLPGKCHLPSPDAVSQETLCAWNDFVMAISNVSPLPLHVAQRVESLRSGEAHDVDRHVPRTEAPWDCAPHTCRGAEMQVKELRASLSRAGWHGLANK